MTTYNVLITGANRGLGVAMTVEFLKGGHRVYTINRHRSDAERRLQEQFQDRIRIHSGDVSDEASIRSAIEAIGRQAQHLDMVVNNAAVNLDKSSPLLEEVDFSVYLPSFQINAVGPLMVVKHALPWLRKGELKRIANISSEAGSIGASGRKGEYAYCMSKAALNMASKILQNSLRAEGIQVLAVHPGWFSSDMGGPAAPITPAQAAKQVVSLLLNASEVADTIYVNATGETLPW